jgi:hypothetical protein
MPSTDTPSPSSRRPVIRCRRPPEHDGQPLPVPPPGTVVETADGTTVVYVGDDRDNDQQQIKDLSARLRNARTIVLVGWAARRAKHVLGAAWTETTQATREATKTPALPKAPVQLCGQPAKTGNPCGQIAGWGTDTPGQGPCFYHGGSTAEKDAALEALQAQARTFARLHRTAKTKPLTLREQLDATIALREVLLATETKRRRRPKT